MDMNGNWYENGVYVPPPEKVEPYIPPEEAVEFWENFSL